MDVKLNRTPGFGIGRTSHLLNNEIRNGLGQLELNVSAESLSILLLIGEYGDPIRVSDLARLSVRDGTTLKRQLDGLVELGYVFQEKDEADRRAVLISCTTKGLETIDFVAPMLASIRLKALKGIDAVDIQTTFEVLNRIRDNLLIATSDGNSRSKN